VRTVDYIVIGAVVLIALAVLDVAAQVRAIRRLLENDFLDGASTTASETSRLANSSVSTSSAVPAPGPVRDASNPLPRAVAEVEKGFCVWSFRGENWRVELNACRAGYAPTPPTVAGDYEGHCVRTVCAHSL
jgi:hypothetical protein